jgi:hypothetical protein
VAVAALLAGRGTWSAFSQTTSDGPAAFSSAVDWTAPSASASVIAHSSKGPGVKAGGSYAVYANVTDSGNPASGVSTVSANLGSITSGQTTAALSACSSSCTVGGVTYGYKSSTLTANAGLAAGSVSYTLTSKDTAGNTSSAQSFSVTADNTAPTALAGVAAHATAGAALVKQGGSYWVYANATDTGSGVDTVTADVGNLTTGQTAVALSPCPSSCTVNGTTYAYKSAQLSTNGTLSAGSKSITITATDAAGNAGSSSGLTATVDNTAPAASDVQTRNNGSTAGRPEQGDTITLTRSEQMDPDSILSGWTGAATNLVVRIGNSGSGAHDFVTFWNAANTTQLPLGSIDLGGSGYVSTGAIVTFGATGTASSMVQSGAGVTITLGTASSGARTVSVNHTMIWTPSTTPTDLAGNSASGASASESGTSDVDF